MRKVTKTVVEAWLQHKPKTCGNTSTDGERIWLHGNKIVERLDGNRLYISNCNWPTVTTRERLNGVLRFFDAWVSQVNHVQKIVVNGKAQDFPGTMILDPKKGDYTL